MDTQREAIAFERQRLEAETATLKRRSQPDFTITGGGYSSDGQSSLIGFQIINRGQRCTDFHIEIEGSNLRLPMFESGAKSEMNIALPYDAPEGERAYPATLTDALGERGEQLVFLKAYRAGNRTLLRPPEHAPRRPSNTGPA